MLICKHLSSMYRSQCSTVNDLYWFILPLVECECQLFHIYSKTQYCHTYYLLICTYKIISMVLIYIGPNEISFYVFRNFYFLIYEIISSHVFRSLFSIRFFFLIDPYKSFRFSRKHIGHVVERFHSVLCLFISFLVYSDNHKFLISMWANFFFQCEQIV